MIKKTNPKRIMIVIMILLCLSISIGYASLTQIINMDGTISFEKQTNLDVHFEKVVVKEDSVGESIPTLNEERKTISVTVDLNNIDDF